MGAEGESAGVASAVSAAVGSAGVSGGCECGVCVSDKRASDGRRVASDETSSDAEGDSLRCFSASHVLIERKSERTSERKERKRSEPDCAVPAEGERVADVGVVSVVDVCWGGRGK